MFYNLQYGNEILDDLKQFCKIHGVAIHNYQGINLYTDTFANLDMILAMDLIISISNTIVDFAGAMNKNCWLLRVMGREWRWGHHKQRTLFYNNDYKYY